MQTVIDLCVRVLNTVHSTLPIMKKKYAEIFLHYRQLFIKGDVIIGEWEIFGAEVFLHCNQFFIKGNFIIGGVESSSLLGSTFILCLDVICPKERTDVYLKWHLSLFSFKISFLHIFAIMYNILSWSNPSLSYPAIKISAMPSTFVSSLKISYNFLWNMVLAGAAPSGSHFYPYMPY